MPGLHNDSILIGRDAVPQVNTLIPAGFKVLQFHTETRIQHIAGE